MHKKNAESITVNSDLIAPITVQQRQLVLNATEQYIALAAEQLQQQFPNIPVVFDLKGRAAGMYRSYQGKREIRYNPWLFAKYFEDNMQNTIPHEVAHYLSDVLYGIRTIRPHGRQWSALMEILGATPSRKHTYDLSGIPQRNLRRYTYRCACRHYELGAQRHRRISRGVGFYSCRQCETHLRYCGES